MVDIANVVPDSFLSPLPPGEGGRRPGEGKSFPSNEARRLLDPDGQMVDFLSTMTSLPPGEGGRRPGEGFLDVGRSPDRPTSYQSPLPPGEGTKKVGPVPTGRAKRRGMEASGFVRPGLTYWSVYRTMSGKVVGRGTVYLLTVLA